MRPTSRIAALLLLGACAGAEAPLPADTDAVEATSLLGEPLVRPAIDGARRDTMERQLTEARVRLEENPDDADAIIWVGRRLAYLGRYRQAIDVFGEGIAKHPGDARMYRHRGHRWITVREFDRAIEDLTRAAELVEGRPDEVEPDGQPNAAGIPVSTLQSNIWYHLALAHYLKHDFEAALPAWLRAMEVSANDDMKVATGDWLYMTYRRLGREDEAARVLEPIHADMRILENTAYHRRLLMYKGEIPPDSLLDVREADPVQVATYGYGVGNWYLYNGDEERAAEVFRTILTGPNWAAFGYIAAEAELAAGTAPR